MGDLRFDLNCPPPLEGISMQVADARPNAASRLCGWLWNLGLHWLSWKVSDLYFWQRRWRDRGKPPAIAELHSGHQRLNVIIADSATPEETEALKPQVCAWIDSVVAERRKRL